MDELLRTVLEVDGWPAAGTGSRTTCGVAASPGSGSPGCPRGSRSPRPPPSRSRCSPAPRRPTPRDAARAPEPATGQEVLLAAATGAAQADDGSGAYWHVTIEEPGDTYQYWTALCRPIPRR